jgi:DNA polymerase III sliding clamp (beta) subunit (PCNA family)
LQFTDLAEGPAKGATFYVQEGADAEAVAAKLADVRERFAKAVVRAAEPVQTGVTPVSTPEADGVKRTEPFASDLPATIDQARAPGRKLPANSLILFPYSFPDESPLVPYAVEHGGDTAHSMEIRQRAKSEAARRDGVEVSHGLTLGLWTDAYGNPEYVVSPNGRLSKVGTPHAAYIAGDLNAHEKDRVRRMQEGKTVPERLAPIDEQINAISSKVPLHREAVERASRQLAQIRAEQAQGTTIQDAGKSNPMFAYYASWDEARRAIEGNLDHNRTAIKEYEDTVASLGKLRARVASGWIPKKTDLDSLEPAPAAGVTPVSTPEAQEPTISAEKPAEMPGRAPMRASEAAGATRATKPEPEIIPQSRDLKITNLDQLPRGTGARYLEVVRGEDGVLVAKQWRRKPVAGAVLVDTEARATPAAPAAVAPVSTQEAQEPTASVTTSERIIPETGKPFEFQYVRNRNRAPDMGSRFGQDIEPAGKYMTVGAPESVAGRNDMETGTARFENPLVVPFGAGYGEPSNWKSVLRDRYGKTGKALSQAIRDDGYDGIVTVDKLSRTGEQYTSEIVDLGMLSPKRTPKRASKEPTAPAAPPPAAVKPPEATPPPTPTEAPPSRLPARASAEKVQTAPARDYSPDAISSLTAQEFSGLEPDDPRVQDAARYADAVSVGGTFSLDRVKTQKGRKEIHRVYIRYKYNADTSQLSEAVLRSHLLDEAPSLTAHEFFAREVARREESKGGKPEAKPTTQAPEAPSRLPARATAAKAQTADAREPWQMTREEHWQSVLAKARAGRRRPPWLIAADKDASVMEKVKRQTFESHRRYVENVIEHGGEYWEGPHVKVRGTSVPPEVLAEYPDLKTSAAPAVVAPVSSQEPPKSAAKPGEIAVTTDAAQSVSAPASATAAVLPPPPPADQTALLDVPATPVAQEVADVQSRINAAETRFVSAFSRANLDAISDRFANDEDGISLYVDFLNAAAKGTFVDIDFSKPLPRRMTRDQENEIDDAISAFNADNEKEILRKSVEEGARLVAEARKQVDVNKPMLLTRRQHDNVEDWSLDASENEEELERDFAMSRNRRVDDENTPGYYVLARNIQSEQDRFDEFFDRLANGLKAVFGKQWPQVFDKLENATTIRQAAGIALTELDRYSGPRDQVEAVKKLAAQYGIDTAEPETAPAPVVEPARLPPRASEKKAVAAEKPPERPTPARVPVRASEAAPVGAKEEPKRPAGTKAEMQAELKKLRDETARLRKEADALKQQGDAFAKAADLMTTRGSRYSYGGRTPHIKKSAKKADVEKYRQFQKDYAALDAQIGALDRKASPIESAIRKLTTYETATDEAMSPITRAAARVQLDYDEGRSAKASEDALAEATRPFVLEMYPDASPAEVKELLPEFMGWAGSQASEGRNVTADTFKESAKWRTELQIGPMRFQMVKRALKDAGLKSWTPGEGYAESDLEQALPDAFVDARAAFLDRNDAPTRQETEAMLDAIQVAVREAQAVLDRKAAEAEAAAQAEEARKNAFAAAVSETKAKAVREYYDWKPPYAGATHPLDMVRSVINQNNVLGALRHVAVINGRATGTDLDTYISAPTGMPDGMYKFLTRSLIIPVGDTADTRDFPPLPTIEALHTVKLPNGTAPKFAEAVRRALTAASTDETRRIITGVCLTKTSDGKLAVLATSGSKLAFSRLDVDTSQLPDGWKVVLAPGMAEAIARDPHAPSATLEIEENAAKYSNGNVEITSRVIDGEYPVDAFMALLDAAPASTVSADRTALKKALAGLVKATKGNRNARTAIAFEDGQLTLRGTRANNMPYSVSVPASVVTGHTIGDFTSAMSAYGTPGNPLLFSADSMADMLSSINGDKAYLTTYTKTDKDGKTWTTLGMDETLEPSKAGDTTPKRPDPWAMSTPSGKPGNPLKVAQAVIPGGRAIQILRDVLVKDGTLYATDLDNTVEIPTTLKNGLYEGKTLLPDDADPKEFPPVEKPKKYEGQATIAKSAAASFLRALGMARKAVSIDETRRIITGVLLRFEDGKLVVVGVDGRRLHTSTVAVSKSPTYEKDKNPELVLPAPAVDLLLRSNGTDGLTLKWGGNHLVVDDGNVVLTAKLISGVYPNWRQVVPKNEKALVVNRTALGNALESLFPYVGEKNNYIRMTVADGTMTLTADNVNLGPAGRESVTVPVSDKDAKLSATFNPWYLDDMLRTIGSGDDVRLEYKDGHSPVLLRDAKEKDGGFGALMPLRVGARAEVGAPATAGVGTAEFERALRRETRSMPFAAENVTAGVSEDDAPVWAQGEDRREISDDRGRVRAVTVGNRSHFFLNRYENVEQLRRDIREEAGHRLVNELGGEEWGAISRQVYGGAEADAIAKEIERNYGHQPGTEEFNHELVAKMVRDGTNNAPFWRRVLDAVVAAIRRAGRALRFNLDLADSELRHFVNRMLRSKLRRMDEREGVNLRFAPSAPLRSVREGQQDTLVALHNLSAENLMHADKLGGIAVPSIAITRPDIPFNSFGDITLVGTRDMVDPLGRHPVSVFNADAWTTRHPDVVWAKVLVSKAQPIMDRVRQAQKDTNDHRFSNEIWDYMVNRPDKNKALDRAKTSTAAKLQFLRENGRDAKTVMRDIEPRRSISKDAEVIAFLRAHPDVRGARLEDDIYREAQVVLKAAIERNIQKEADGNADLEQLLRKGYKRQVLNEEGDVAFGIFDSIWRDADNVGKREIDEEATRQAVKAELKAMPDGEQKFLDWVEALLNVYRSPMVRVRGRLQPYSLDSIVEAMTTQSVRGREEGMTFGEGKARGASAKKLRSISEMHAEEKILKTEKAQKEYIEKVQKPLMETFRTSAAQLRREGVEGRASFGTSWEAFDDSMKALADYLKGGSVERSPGRMRRALARNYFRGVEEWFVEEALDAAHALADAPSDYFEAKPLRGVPLSEFIGAVVPNDASQAVVDVLERNGIRRIERYDGYNEDQRAAAVRRIADRGGVRFAPAARPRFYSALTRAVESLPDGFKSPGDQFARALEGRRNKGQPWKQQEADETGFADWLKMQQENGKPVTKADALAFLEQNGVRVETVRKGENKGSTFGGITEYDTTENDAGETVRSYSVELPEGDFLDVGFIVEHDSGASVTRIPNGNTEDFDTLASAERFLEAHAERQWDTAAASEDRTKFSQYAPPGGVPGSYREVLLTVPGNPLTKKMATAFDSSGNIMAQGSLAASEEWKQEHPEWRVEIEDIADESANRAAGQYSSPHWSEPNVIAHMLMDERRIPLDVLAKTLPELAAKLRAAGKTEARALHVIEAQSDLHQAGAAKGYVEPVVERKNGWSRYADGRWIQDSEIPSGQVPALPMRGDAWKRLVIRKMLSEAVDGGYDLLTWSTGADRFKKWGSQRVDWKRGIDGASLGKIWKPSQTGGGKYRLEYADGTGHVEILSGKSGDFLLFRTEAEAKAHAKTLRETSRDGWTVSAQEQAGGEHAGQNIEALARERGVLLEQKGKTVRTKEDLRRVIESIKRGDDTNVDKLTDRIWERMQTEPEGTSLPRKEFFEFLYDTSFRNEASDIVRKMGEGAGVGRVERLGMIGGMSAPMPAHAIPITDAMRAGIEQGQPYYAPSRLPKRASRATIQPTGAMERVATGDYNAEDIHAAVAAAAEIPARLSRQGRDGERTPALLARDGEVPGRENVPAGAGTLSEDFRGDPGFSEASRLASRSGIAAVPVEQLPGDVAAASDEERIYLAKADRPLSELAVHEISHVLVRRGNPAVTALVSAVKPEALEYWSTWFLSKPTYRVQMVKRALDELGPYASEKEISDHIDRQVAEELAAEFLTGGSQLADFFAGDAYALRAAAIRAVLGMEAPATAGRAEGAGIRYAAEERKGPPSTGPPVTPEQDRAYLAAVERGDTETAQRMVDEAAKRAGYNVGPVWHGTSAPQFTSFDTSKAKDIQGKELGLGWGPGIFWFAGAEGEARKYSQIGRGRGYDESGTPRTVRAFLRVNNPWDASYGGGNYGDIQAARDGYGAFGHIKSRSARFRQLVRDIRAKGFDAIVHPPAPERDYGYTKMGRVVGEYGVFDPAQIKSADAVTRDSSGRVIPLSERFNTQTPDIRFAPAEPLNPRRTPPRLSELTPKALAAERTARLLQGRREATQDIREALAGVRPAMQEARRSGVPMRASEALRGLAQDMDHRIRETEATLNKVSSVVSLGEKATAKDIRDAQGAMRKFISDHMPREELKRNEWRELEKDVIATQTAADIEKIAPQVVDLADRANRRILTSAIKGLWNKIKHDSRMAVDILHEVTDLLEPHINEGKLVVRGPDAATRAKAARLRAEAAVDRAILGGAFRELTDSEISALRSLAVKPLSEMSADELRELRDKMVGLQKMGRFVLKVRRAVRRSRADAAAEAVAGSLTPAGDFSLRRDVNGLTWTEKAGNSWRQKMGTWNWYKNIVSPADSVFMDMQGSRSPEGAVMQTFKRPVDVADGRWAVKYADLVTETREKVKELDINPDRQELIGVHAIMQQETGEEKLLNAGYDQVQLHSLPELTANETEFLNWMRGKMDALFPVLQRIARDYYNTDLKKEDFYFPFLTDWEYLQGRTFAEMFAEEGDQVVPIKAGASTAGRTTHTPQGFMQERVGAGRQPVQTNALRVFLTHMNHALYYAEMEPTLQDLNKVLANENLRKAMGPERMEFMRNWMDTVARHGGVESAYRWPGIERLVSLVGAAKLAFKLPTALVQTTPIILGLPYNGAYQLRAAVQVPASYSLRQWIYANSPEVRFRMGNDPAYDANAVQTILRSIVRSGFYPLVKIDRLAASITWFAAYNDFMAKAGKPVDISKPADPEGAYHADVIMRRVNASQHGKDMPAVLSRGTMTPRFRQRSIARAAFQFQNPLFFVSDAVRRDVLEASQGVAFAVFVALTWLAASAWETAERRFLRRHMQPDTWKNRQKYAGATERLLREQLSNAGVDESRDWANLFMDYGQQALGNIPGVMGLQGFSSEGRVGMPVVDTVHDVWSGTADLFSYKPGERRQGAEKATRAAIGGLVPGGSAALQIKEMATGERDLWR